MEYEEREKSAPQDSKLLVRLPILLALAMAVGIALGATMFGGGGSLKGTLLNYQKYREVLQQIEENYVDTVNVEELVDFSIEKLLERLDPHTSFIPKRDVAMANVQLEGDFEGIGVEFNLVKDTIYIVAPIPEGPSESVGIRAGDRIVSIDGENVAGVKIDNAGVFKRLRGKKNSQVRLGIVRRGQAEPIYFNVTRGKIPSISVYHYMIDPGKGFIKITRFARNTYEEFRIALEDLRRQGMKELIIDLRDNPGGYMDAAVQIADELLAEKTLIVYTKGKGRRFDGEQFAKRSGLFEKGALVVLINEGSASASEILAGALQDNDRALIVGRRSFGKGLVQMPINLSDGSELRLTISRYYTPSGRSIQKDYKNGKEYEKDLTERFQHGEFFTADSIKLDESLRYKTKKGRNVYGGGGIMPDYFIPLDTTKSSPYLNALYEQNIPREWAAAYVNQHQERLKAMTLEDFKKKFVFDAAMWQQLGQSAVQAGISLQIQAKERPLIEGQLKALIAKSIWNNEGFYSVWYEQDELYQEALRRFAEAAKI
jgi:carboxyl-terminal processing protease